MFDQIGTGFAQDADEVFLVQRLQFDPDRQAPLQFGQHVARLGDVERAAGDEQHVVGLHRAVLGGYGGPLDQRQQIALHAFAADRAAAHIADRDLVDFIDEHDAVGFGIGQRDAGDVVLVHPLFGFFLDQLVPRIGHFQLAPLQVLAAQRLAHHVRQVDHADIAAHAGDLERHGGGVLHLDLHLDIVHRIFDQPLAKALARCLAGVFTDQRLQQPVHRRLAGRFAHGFAAAVLFQPDRFFHQIAGNLFDIAADIANLGELGRFHLHERRIGQPGQTAADLGLAAAGRPDHQDVLGRDFIAQFRAQPLATPPVAQRHSHRALGVLLADDVFVQRADNRLGGQGIGHEDQISSRVTRSLVKTQTSAATAIARRAIRSGSLS